MVTEEEKRIMKDVINLHETKGKKCYFYSQGLRRYVWKIEDINNMYELCSGSISVIQTLKTTKNSYFYYLEISFNGVKKDIRLLKGLLKRNR